MGRKTAVVLVCLVLFTCSLGASAQVLCRFAVAGDVRPQLGFTDHIGASPVFLRTIGAINRMAPDLTILTGDYIFGGSSLIPRQVAERQWDAFAGAIRRFLMPVRLVPGNHDVWDNVSKQLYEHYCGQTQYSFDDRGVFFICLNTCQQFSDGQVRWLAGQLAAAKGRPTFLFMHHPLWWPGARLHGQPTATHPTDEFWTKNIHPLLVRAGNVQAVIASHEHMYVHQIFDGIHYIISGGGGAEPRDAGGELTGSFHHFLMVAVQKDRAKTQFAVLPIGAVMPVDFINPDQRYDMLDAVTHLRNWPEVDKGYPADIAHKIELKNPFTGPMEVEVIAAVDADSAWKVTPAENRVTIAPGRTAVLAWHIRCPKVATPLPTFFWHVRCGPRQAEGKETLWLH